MFSLAPAYPIPFPIGNLLPRWVSHLMAALQALLAVPVNGKIPGVMDQETQKKMVQEALEGDEGFEKLVRAFEKMVYRVAFRFLNDPVDSVDACQEIFLRVYRSLSGFRGDSALSTWVYAIAVNHCRNAIRSRKNREKVQVLETVNKNVEGLSLFDRAVDPRDVNAAQAIERGNLNKTIQEAMHMLPPDFREAVILRDLEGLNYGDIAKELKVSPGTVKSRIARGRVFLREKLKEWL